jgi:hypothetical protein
VVARQHLGGAQAWGLILTAGAVGGVLGGFLAYRIRPTRPAAAAFAVWSLGALPPLFLVQPFPLAALMVASGVFSISIVLGNALWETTMQQEVRPERLARVGSIDWLLSLCLMPVGQAVAGALAASIGLRATLVLSATLMSIPNLFVLAFVREVRAVRRRDAYGPAPAS